LLRRTSLDEIPQLINVAAGHMSLVGPRMIAPDETVKFGDALARRLAVKPGITGLWQVSGRQELAYADRIRLDLHYIENWSLWLDLAILARTIPAVLSMRGAY
jgi:lipopolysaccharide/colanic/teichoic acid biosynthesis glycosyltransferase